MAIAVKLLVIEAMRNTVSASTGLFAATSRKPAVPMCATSPSTTMPHAAPGTCCSATNAEKIRSTSAKPAATFALSVCPSGWTVSAIAAARASRPLDFIARMIVPVIRRVDLRTERRAAWTLVVLAVLIRSAIFVFWEQAHFDSDQAVIGLMAKQLAEGRAFPMFLYGSNYIFAVEAWMAAPVFLVAGASVAALKLPLLAINIVIALLLGHLLERDGGLRPAYAAAASLFFILPPPGTSMLLVEASGVNVEPFLYTILLWMTRTRPAWFGVIFAVGFLQREFTAYALVALAVVAAIDGRLFTRDALRRAAIATVSAGVVFAMVALLRPYSSAAGPGTSLADMRATSSVQEAVGRICFDPAATFDGVRTLATVHWMRLFGLQAEPLLDFAINSAVSQGIRGAWLLLAAAAIIAVVRILAAAAATRRISRAQYFPIYVALSGLISAAAFVLLRCGAVGPLRYALLSLFAAVGVSAWYLQIERSPIIRNVLSASARGICRSNGRRSSATCSLPWWRRGRWSQPRVTPASGQST
jgi:hypothetical protein